MTTKKFSIIVLILSIFISFVFTQTPTDPDEVQALIAFNTATGGSNWVNKWNTSSDPCLNNWFGVQCTGNHVYSISLQSNNLKGEISDLSALTYLQFFYLSENLITGTIPDSLSIPSLLQLGLDNNSLTGTIPYLFSNLTLLQTLYLQNNQLVGDIDFLGSLINAVYVYFSNNQLSGTISEAIADLFLLQQLGLDSNQFSGSIPAGLGANQNYLASFYGQNNNFSGTLSSTLPLCTNNVTSCDLSNNDFACPVPNPPCCQVTLCSN